MRGHNKIHSAIADIVENHSQLQLLLSQAGERATSIGNILISIQPELKEAKLSISELCRELPFGKTAAYEYIALAKGKTSWEELYKRKNPVKNSATAEKLIANEDWVTENAELFNISKDLIRKWEKHRLDISDDPELSKLAATPEGFKKALDRLRDSGPNKELTDEEIETLRWLDGVAIIKGLKLNYTHPRLSELLAEGRDYYDSYNFAYSFVLVTSILENMKDSALTRGDISGAKSLIKQQKTFTNALYKTKDEVLMLAALVGNSEANFEALKHGKWTEHQLYPAYCELLGKGRAEDWCCEAIYEEAINHLEDKIGDSKTAQELKDLKADRNPFWLLASKAIDALNGRI